MLKTLKKAQNWYQQEKGRRQNGSESTYEGMIRAKIVVHDEGNKEEGKRLSYDAILAAMRKGEEVAPHSSTSENSNIYISGVSFGFQGFI